MPDASIKSTNKRAVLAGFGTTASLSGAATVAALVVTGVVAFSSWPDGATRQAPAPVRLANPAPSGDSGVALAASAATSAAPEASATTGASPGNTPTPVPGSGVEGEAGTGNVPVAAAATPSPQSPTGTPGTTPAPASRTTDAVADATVAASKEVGRGVESAAGTAGKATDNLFPRTTGVMSAMAAGAGQSTGAAAEAVSEIIRALPLGDERRTATP